MQTLTSTAREASHVIRVKPASGVERFSALHARARHRRVLGVRLSAIIEVVVLVGLVLLIDRLWGPGNRFASIKPHPLWIPVLLAATYYGTREALWAAAVGTAALSSAVSIRYTTP